MLWWKRAKWTWRRKMGMGPLSLAVVAALCSLCCRWELIVGYTYKGLLLLAVVSRIEWFSVCAVFRTLADWMIFGFCGLTPIFNNLKLPYRKSTLLQASNNYFRYCKAKRFENEWEFICSKIPEPYARKHVNPCSTKVLPIVDKIAKSILEGRYKSFVVNLRGFLKISVFINQEI